MKAISRAVLGASVAALLALPAAAEIKAGTVQLRGRVICICPDDSSGEVSGIADSGVSVDDAITPEFDVTVFLAQHVALEIIAATAKHDISGEGAIEGLGEIADTGVLPPTLLIQAHFRPEQKFRPYVGAGINYTLFYDEDTTNSLETALGGDTKISLDESFGWALQAGFDVAINDHWFFNFDVKYIDIDTEAVLVTDDGFDTRRTVDVDINPWVPGFGFGYRFD